MHSIHPSHQNTYHSSVRLPSIRDLFPDLLLTSPTITTPTSASQARHRPPLLRLVAPCFPPPSEASPSSGCPTRNAPHLAQHGKSRKHVCPECQKRFNRPSSLSIHLHTHTGERPYTCPHPGCLRTFNVSSNMRRHFRSHEADGVPGSQQFPYSSPSPSPTSSTSPLAHSPRYPTKPY